MLAPYEYLRGFLMGDIIVGKFRDITGQRFGKLVAIRRVGVKEYPSGGHLTLWECRCDCGNTTVVNLAALVTGNTRTCGCSHRGENAAIAKIARKHGKSKTRLYILWKQIKKRCNNPHDMVYKYYGALGVKVCKEWENNFENFEKWAMENGYDENAPRGQCTIDRINPFLGYSPENCRWITLTEQRHNRRKDWIKSENSLRQQGKMDTAK